MKILQYKQNYIWCLYTKVQPLVITNFENIGFCLKPPIKFQKCL